MNWRLHPGQEVTFKQLEYQHPTVMSFLIAFVSMCIGAAGGGFRGRRAPIRSHASVGLLRCAISLCVGGLPTVRRG